MSLNLGLGLSLSKGIARGININDITLAIAGDSIANGWFTVGGTTELETALDLYFDSSATEDFAQGGMHLYRTVAEYDNPAEVLYFWDDQAGTPTKSARYDVLGALLNNPEDINAMIFYIGTNDIRSASTGAVTLDKDTYKNNAKALFNYMVNVDTTYFPNLQAIFLFPWHRRDAGATTLEETNANTVTDALREVCAEVPYVYEMASIYDVDLLDDDHPTLAARQGIMSDRTAAGLGNYAGKSDSVGTIGPRVTSAELLLDRVRATITQDKGTGLTIDTDSWLAHKAVVGGAKTAISNAIEVDTNVIDFFLPEGQGSVSSSTDLRIGYGYLEELSRTGVEGIRDNATPNYPLRKDIISVSSETDVFQNLTDLHTYFGARPSAKTYSSSTNVSQIDGLFSSANCVTDAGREPNYDSALFGGAGGLESNDVTTHLESASTAIDFSGGCSFYIVFKSPASLTAEVPVFALGNQFHTGNTRSKLVISTGGVLRWGDKEDDTFLDISTIGASSTNFLAMSFNAAEDEARYSLNGGAWTTFDPFDVTAAAVSFIMFASRPTFNAVVGLEIGMCAVTTAYWDSDNDPSIADMWAQANTLYSIS